jgi:hypothetical protein
MLSAEGLEILFDKETNHSKCRCFLELTANCLRKAISTTESEVSHI